VVTAGYGRCGKLMAVPGRRDELAALLRRSTDAVATADGCTLYLVGIAADDPDGVWVTEPWDDRKSHQASLQIEAVRALITEGMPLIAGMGDSVEMTEIGGFGLDG
jgi:quinol monooxygenase YgiN